VGRMGKARSKNGKTVPHSDVNSVGKEKQADYLKKWSVSQTRKGGTETAELKCDFCNGGGGQKQTMTKSLVLLRNTFGEKALRVQTENGPVRRGSMTNRYGGSPSRDSKGGNIWDPAKTSEIRGNLDRITNPHSRP